LADYEIPENCRYTRDDEWVRQEGDRLVIGITDYAQKQLGDIVFLELPETGFELKTGKPFGVVESVKAVSDLCAPIDGEVIESNPALEDAPERVNTDCYDTGWILTASPSDPSAYEALMDAKAYRHYVADRED
jgi:glycine cleavage system H protein